MFALFALAAAVGWGSSDFAAGSARRRSSATAIVILTHLASVLALFFVAVRFGPGGLSLDGSPTAGDLARGLAAGVASGAGTMLLFRGLDRGSRAVVAPITATGAASIPIVYGIITGDPVSAFSILGIALALVAIVLVSIPGRGRVADPALEDPMTWPDTWADEFQPTAPDSAPVMAPPISLAPSATTAQGTVQTLNAPPVGAPLAPPHTASAHSTVLLPPPPRDGNHHGELRISLRIVREAVLALVATAVMSSAAIAARPIDQLLQGAEYSAAIAALYSCSRSSSSASPRLR